MSRAVAVCGALSFAPMKPKTPGSDPIHKRLYAFPEMVADLLRSLFPGNRLGADYGSLRKLPAEYVGDDFRQLIPCMLFISIRFVG